MEEKLLGKQYSRQMILMIEDFRHRNNNGGDRRFNELIRKIMKAVDKK